VPSAIAAISVSVEAPIVIAFTRTEPNSNVLR
jgi:hypothetical protein